MSSFQQKPWLNEAYKKLINLQQKNRIPPVLGIEGSLGLGKRLLAVEWIRYLHCKNPNQCQACGQCEACKKESNPDILVIEPGEMTNTLRQNDAPDYLLKPESYSVDVIRALQEKLTRKSASGNTITVYCAAFDQLTLQAHNALLKLLEEMRQIRFVMVFNQRSKLPETILSRMQLISVKAPLADVAMQSLKAQLTKTYDDALIHRFLKISGYAPDLAAVLLENASINQPEKLKILLKASQDQKSALPLTEIWQFEKLDDVAGFYLFQYFGYEILSAIKQRTLTQANRERLHRLLGQWQTLARAVASSSGVKYGAALAQVLLDANKRVVEHK